MRLWPVSVVLLILTVSVSAQRNTSTVDYCSVFSEGTQTTGPIRIKGLMTWSTVTRVDGGDPYFYSPGCNNPDYFAVTDSSVLKNNGTLIKFIDRLPKEKSFILEVDATGRMVNSFIPVFGHLSWSRASFRIDRINSIANVTGRRNLVKPNVEAASPSTDLANSLRFANSEIMLLFLAGDSRMPDVDWLVDDAFTAIDPNGRAYKKANYTDLVPERLFDELKGYPSRFVQGPDRVTKNGDLYVLSGMMGIESAAGEKKQLRYENTFRVTNDSIRLVKTRLTKQ